MLEDENFNINGKDKGDNGAVIPNYFNWMTPDEQKQNTYRLENITNKEHKNQIIEIGDMPIKGNKNQIIQTELEQNKYKKRWK